MAVETVKQITAPPEFLEAEAKLYLDQLRPAIAGFKGADLSQVYGPQFQAGLGALTQDAISKAGGLGSFEPYLQTAATEAGQAGQFVGPTAYQQFMSPFQKDIIDTSLAEFDRQTAAGIPALNAQAIQAGAFGGGRQGVQQAEFLSNQARNRAALQAQLLGQGFGQAQQLASQNFAQQMNLAQATPALLGQQIGALSTLGAQQQAQAQAVANQPLQAAQTLGSGIMGLISGYPGGTQTQMQPTPSPLQTALSAGATLAGIYRALD